MRPYQLLLAFLYLSLTGCVSSPKKLPQPELSQEQINQMEKALSFMKKKEFRRAGRLYEQLSISLKDSSAKILMLFNAGVSYKEAGECKEALLRQKSVLDHSLKIPEFKSRSLLELSYIYECLGDSEMALLILKDLKKFRKNLPWDSHHILYPARLSLAFARLGDDPQTDKYASISLNKVLEYKKSFSSEKDMQEKVSRIFYLMGRSYYKKEHLKDFAFEPAFFYHQLFLLQSLFLKDKTWSKLAEQELNKLFDKLFFLVSQRKEKHKYKKRLKEALKTGSLLVEMEKSKKWSAFYNKKSRSILNLL